MPWLGHQIVGVSRVVSNRESRIRKFARHIRKFPQQNYTYIYYLYRVRPRVPSEEHTTPYLYIHVYTAYLIWSENFESSFQSSRLKLVGLFCKSRVWLKPTYELWASNFGKSFRKCHFKLDRLYIIRKDECSLQSRDTRAHFNSQTLCRGDWLLPRTKSCHLLTHN